MIIMEVVHIGVWHFHLLISMYVVVLQTTNSMITRGRVQVLYQHDYVQYILLSFI
jgi:hypothetical protein